MWRLNLLEDDGKIVKKCSHNNSNDKVKKNTEVNPKTKSCFIQALSQDGDMAEINSVIVNVSSIMEKYKMVRKE